MINRVWSSFHLVVEFNIPLDRSKSLGQNGSLLMSSSGRRHVALKLFINNRSMGQQLDNELEMYKRISVSSSKHPGRSAVRELLDSFDVVGPDGSHRCLVHPPLWESMWTFLNRNPVRRLPPVVLAVTLRRLFLALDYLHTECNVIHTGMLHSHQQA